MKTVYLAGPISGLDFSGAVDWRDRATADLARAGIKGLSPMRAKEYLRGVENLDPAGHGEFSVLSSPKGITTRDRFDTTRCDVVLVNFLGAQKPSLGTVMELAWADLARTPIVAVMEPGNVHEHAMICEVIGFRVATLDDGLALVKAILA